MFIDSKKSAKKSSAQMAPVAPDLSKMNLEADSTELLNKLRWQVDFYFSDSNLVRDKFLRKQLNQSTAEHPFNCVAISELASFPRLKTLLSGSPTPVGDLFKRALKSSRVVKVTKSKEHVKRRLPFKISKEMSSDLDSSTLYVENLEED